MNRFDYLMVCVLSVASLLGVNPYVYGLFNHYVSIPFIQDLLEPQLFPGDMLLAEQENFFTWFNVLVAALSNISGLGLEEVYFGIYCIALFFSFLCFYSLAMGLFGRREIALVACLLLLFGVGTLGGVSTLESLALERQLVLPLQFLALAACFRKQWIWAWVLNAIAFLMHPLSAVYVAAILAWVGIWESREWKQFFPALLVFVIICSPSLWMKFTSDAPSMPLFEPDATWMQVLKERSPHHVYPSLWSPILFGQAAASVLSLAILLYALPLERFIRKRIAMMAVAVLLLGIAGTLFVEVVPSSLAIQFQFWRSFRFLTYLNMLLMAYAIYLIWERRGSLILLLPVLVGAIFWTALDGPKLIGFIGLLAMILLGFPLIEKYRSQIQTKYLLSACFLLALIAGKIILEGPLQIDSAQEAEWRDVQKWANQNTPLDAGFIVPPDKRGFRLESKRGLFTDWNDGTQSFFNHHYAAEWLYRIRLLGYDGKPENLRDNFNQLQDSQIEALLDYWDHTGPSYLISPKENIYNSILSESELENSETLLGWEKQYENDLYQVILVRDPECMYSRRFQELGHNN
jgi:hypothetical protein